MHFEITKYYSREELDVLAKKCGLVQRESPITGFTIAVMATTGLLNTPDGTLAQLAAHLSSALQTNVSPQAIDARLGDAAMAFMHCCLEKAFSMAARPPPLVGRDVNLVNDFAHLYIIDSTNFELHPSLKDVFTGSSGASSPSSMRIQLIHDYITGRIYVMIGDTKMCDAPALQNVVDSDILDLSGKCLFLSDLGYFKIDTFKNIHSKEMFFISKLSFGVSLSDASGEKIDLERLMKSSEAFDIPVVIAGSKFRLTGQKLSDADINKRLRKAARSAQCKRGNTISDKYRLFLQYALTLTNLPELFTISALFTVYRLRWQIELIFKAWKSILQIHKIRSARIPRVMCQVYGKLIVAVVSMQILGTIESLSSSVKPIVLSPFKVTKHLQAIASELSQAIWAGSDKLKAFLLSTAEHIARLCIKKTQKSKPSIETRLKKEWPVNANAVSSPMSETLA
jgi:hypothetical protein